MHYSIEQALRTGLIYLDHAQQQSGGFLSLSADNPEFEAPETYLTTFTAALILNCLNKLAPNEMAEKIRKRAAQFLLAQRSPQWSFNYWTRNSAEGQRLPYPDDADDTFCALAALQELGLATQAGALPSGKLPASELPTGEILAAATNLLVRLETAPGGPYRTWLTRDDDDKWRDVDVAVNANIAYFLQQQKIALPPLLNFLDSAIAENKILSPYYPSPYPLYYFLSRLAGLPNRQLLWQSLSQYMHAHPPKNPLEWSLVTICARALKADPAEYLARLSKFSFSEISKPYPMCIDPMLHGRVYFNGSPALSVALYMEALSPGKRPGKLKLPGSKSGPKKILSPFHKRVLNQVNTRLSSLPEAMRTVAGEYMKKLVGGTDRLHIIDLAERVAKSLGLTLPAKILEQLGAASLFGWIAYTIYDDIADEGKAAYRPLANSCLEETNAIYRKIFIDDGATLKLYRAYMNEMDRAIKQESADDESLVQRSKGVLFSGIAPLLAAGQTANSPAATMLAEFLSAYLIARQLNDDAHDWQEDLAAGRITPVTQLILKNKPETERSRHYWQDIVPQVLERITAALNRANSLLTDSLIINPGPLRDMLAPLQQAADQAARERTTILDFLNTYQP